MASKAIGNGHLCTGIPHFIDKHMAPSPIYRRGVQIVSSINVTVRGSGQNPQWFWGCLVSKYRALAFYTFSSQYAFFLGARTEAVKATNRSGIGVDLG
jgi:hypothetical protein